ncbi:hypothetical protein CsatB_016390 [Cannabis sativa]
MCSLFASLELTNLCQLQKLGVDLVDDSGVGVINSKTHMKLLLKWMRGRKMLKLWSTGVGSSKKFLLSTLPEDPKVTQIRSDMEVKIQHKKPSSSKGKKKTR